MNRETFGICVWIVFVFQGYHLYGKDESTFVILGFLVMHFGAFQFVDSLLNFIKKNKG